jgi:hypothetical protein
LSFSLALVAGFAHGSDLASLAQRMRAAPSARAAVELVRNDSDAMDDPDISQAVSAAGDASAKDRDRILAMVELRAMTEGHAAAPAVSGEAKSIKRSGLYADAGVRETNSWFSDAIARLKNIRLPRMPDLPKPSSAPSTAWVVYLMWGLLGAAILALAFLAAKHFSWKTKLARKAKAVLEEDEPERTLDEWLQTADELAARGAYREAVRALYLACLLRFDEHRVARFDRHETNWEHLSRIHSSARRPSDLDFTPPTKAFDRIWYGKRVNGMADVDEFRAWYRHITESLKGAAA